jgi:hypothetical protein
MNPSYGGILSKIYRDDFKDNKLKESKINENFEVIYSDGISQKKDFKDLNKALSFCKSTIKDNKNLKDIAIYRNESGFHSTTQEEYLLK